jgi:hypothetical protein
MKHTTLLTIIGISVLSFAAPAINAAAVDSQTQPMYSACNDHDEGDACEYVNPQGQSMNGSCHRGGTNQAGQVMLVCTSYTPGD